MRKSAYRATTVHANDIFTSLVSGLDRCSAKTSFDYEREDDHDAWVASNNAQQAAEDAERRQELADRTHAHQEALASAQFEEEDDYVFRSQENLKALGKRPSSR